MNKQQTLCLITEKYEILNMYQPIKDMFVIKTIVIKSIIKI